MLDQLLLSLSAVCSKLLPIFGAVVLAYLCIFLKRTWKLIDSLTDTVKSLDPTVAKVNESLEKVQAPLDSVVKLSHSMDSIQDKAAAGMEQFSKNTSANVEKMKDFLSTARSKAESAGMMAQEPPVCEEESKEE